MDFFGVSFAVEKSPIKINPLSMIRDFLLKDLTEKVDKIDKKVDNAEEARKISRGNTIKVELQSYKKFLENGIPLTKDDIATVRELYDEYHNTLELNHRGTILYNDIEKMYEEQMRLRDEINKKVI